jgi:hypothetical protein
MYGVGTLPTYSAAEVQDNSWKPGAAIVSSSPGIWTNGDAQRLAYRYWG